VGLRGCTGRHWDSEYRYLKKGLNLSSEGCSGQRVCRGLARPCSGMPPAYSDETVANHSAKIWHGATENRP
jgi:hypothetical protein